VAVTGQYRKGGIGGQKMKVTIPEVSPGDSKGVPSRTQSPKMWTINCSTVDVKKVGVVLEGGGEGAIIGWGCSGWCGGGGRGRG